MNTKFTKGEWILSTQFKVAIGGGNSLTTQMTGDRFASVEEREANAHLIAAAPDMYAELVHSMVMLNNFHKNTGSLGARAQAEIIRVTLDKARGEL